jgi:GNAT superfamily N-acetyltransferase
MLATQTIQEQRISNFDERSFPDPGKVSVTIREIKSSDVTLLQEMHERLSRDSIYYRYLGAHKPSAENLAQLCSSNGSNGTVLVALAAEADEKIVAVACYQKDTGDPSKAEPAVLVEDSYQGRGLGKQILIELGQDAVQNGVESFDTFINPANFRVVNLIQGSGLPYECKYCDGLKQIRVCLRADA